MDIEGAYRVGASREAVWAAFRDPEVMARAVPGGPRIDVDGPDHWSGALTLDLGIWRADLNGLVAFEKGGGPNGTHLITATRAGGRPGRLAVRLAESPRGEAIARYRLTLPVPRSMALFGGGPIRGAAKSLSDRFFQALGREMGVNVRRS